MWDHNATANSSGGAEMSYIRGESREQLYLLPETIDDYVGAENPVRFLDAFVDQLDLAALGFAHATPAETGRPPYDPGDPLRLYLYGYLNRIRSSRRLETEAGRNLDLMWLLRKLRPDFKTIADFRKTNRLALKHVCREFTVLCKRLDLFGGDLVAIDGSKFRALNGKARNFSPAKLQRLLVRASATRTIAGGTRRISSRCSMTPRGSSQPPPSPAAKPSPPSCPSSSAPSGGAACPSGCTSTMGPPIARAISPWSARNSA